MPLRSSDGRISGQSVAFRMHHELRGHPRSSCGQQVAVERQPADFCHAHGDSHVATGAATITTFFARLVLVRAIVGSSTARASGGEWFIMVPLVLEGPNGTVLAPRGVDWWSARNIYGRRRPVIPVHVGRDRSSSRCGRVARAGNRRSRRGESPSPAPSCRRCIGPADVGEACRIGI